MSNLSFQKSFKGENRQTGSFSKIHEDEHFILLSQFTLLNPLPKAEERQSRYLTGLILKNKGKMKDLKELNERLVEFLRKNSPLMKFDDLLNSVNDWLKKEVPQTVEMNLALLQIKEENVSFSSLGNIFIYLLEKTGLKDLSQKFEEEKREFIYSTSGVLLVGNKLLFTTEKISEPAELEKFRPELKLVVENKPLKELLAEFSKEKVSPVFKKPDIKERKTLLHKFSYPQKTLIVVLIIIFLLFSQNLILNLREKNKTTEEEIKQKIALIEEKEKEIEVTQNKSSVYALLSEIEKNLNELAVKKIEKEKFENLENNYFNYLKKFYGLTSLEEPKLLVDLSLFDKTFIPQEIAEIEKNLYTFDQKNNNLYEISKETGKISLLKEVKELGRLSQIFVFDKNTLILSDEKGEIASFNLLNQEFKPLKIEKKHEIKELKDLIIYANKLYLLEEKDIYRYFKIPGGFGKEEKWLKNFSLENAFSFAIDGDIYVLDKDGLSKFFLGKKENFELEKILPEISAFAEGDSGSREGEKNLISIFTSLETNNLYLLEQSRLLIFDKNGVIVRQISSPKFNILKSFLINEKQNKAWIVEGQKIYEITLK